MERQGVRNRCRIWSIAWKLRIDRVVSMERTNIRYVKPEDLQELCDFASIDVSLYL